MKILVTGGAGFIGSHVADAYLAAGHRVVVLDDLSSGSLENLPAAATFVRMSLLNRRGVLQLFERGRFDVVSNHAAQGSVQYSVAHPIVDARVNVIGLLHLLEAGRRTGLKKFIQISSGGTVYGESSTLPVSEGARRVPVSPYGITKSAAEDYLRFYHDVYAIDYSVLRYSNVFGPRQMPGGNASVVATFLTQMRSGKRPTIFGDGRNVRDYTYVQDIVRANLAILRKGSGQCYNIGTGRGTSVLAIFKAVAGEIGYEGEPRFGPDRPGDVKNNYLSAAKARRELGWRARVDLRTGIRLTANYFREATR